MPSSFRPAAQDQGPRMQGWSDDRSATYMRALLGCVRLHLRHLRPRSLRCVRLVAVAGGLRTSETLGIYGLRVGEGVATAFGTLEKAN